MGSTQRSAAGSRGGNIKAASAGAINNPCKGEGWKKKKKEKDGCLVEAGHPGGGSRREDEELKWTPSWTTLPNCLRCEGLGGRRHPWGVTLSALGFSLCHSHYTAQCFMFKWPRLGPTGRGVDRNTGPHCYIPHLYQHFLHCVHVSHRRWRFYRLLALWNGRAFNGHILHMCCFAPWVH